jgi:glycerophosphoryl diester phosphodiesterase
MYPMFKLLQRDNGFAHVCGHRGYSVAAPENTLTALAATRTAGGSSAEIDVALTADGEIVLLHDEFVDRTTNGHGLLARLTYGEVRKLDAGSWFAPEFAGEPVPTLADALALAERIDLGLVVELKEILHVDRLFERLVELAARTSLLEQAIFISFDHVVLKRLKSYLPQARTEGILHARHVDLPGLARAAGLASVSIEHMMFQPEDGHALHEAGVAVRMHLQRPAEYARFAAQGVDLVADVPAWIAAGAVDSISGDDVAWLMEFKRRAAGA